MDTSRYIKRFEISLMLKGNLTSVMVILIQSEMNLGMIRGKLIWKI